MYWCRRAHRTRACLLRRECCQTCARSLPGARSRLRHRTPRLRRTPQTAARARRPQARGWRPCQSQTLGSCCARSSFSAQRAKRACGARCKSSRASSTWRRCFSSTRTSRRFGGPWWCALAPHRCAIPPRLPAAALQCQRHVTSAQTSCTYSAQGLRSHLRGGAGGYMLHKAVLYFASTLPH